MKDIYLALNLTLEEALKSVQAVAPLPDRLVALIHAEMDKVKELEVQVAELEDKVDEALEDQLDKVKDLEAQVAELKEELEGLEEELEGMQELRC